MNIEQRRSFFLNKALKTVISKSKHFLLLPTLNPAFAFITLRSYANRTVSVRSHNMTSFQDSYDS